MKAYRSRAQMERGIEHMAERGYELKTTTGEFTRNPFVLRWNRRKVIATFALATKIPAANP